VADPLGYLSAIAREDPRAEGMVTGGEGNLWAAVLAVAVGDLGEVIASED
jgi:hypothetical protein